MHISSHTAAVVLVEGKSDRQALLAAATKVGRDLAADHVEVHAMGGATNIERCVSDLSGCDVELFGMCDVGEVRYFERALGPDAFTVCNADLEQELIRSIGIDEMVAFIDSQDELKTFRSFQKQPAQRDRTIEQHLHRFCGTLGGRKVRYANAIVEWMPAAQVPAPLRTLLELIL